MNSRHRSNGHVRQPQPAPLPSAGGPARQTRTLSVVPGTGRLSVVVPEGADLFIGSTSGRIEVTGTAGDVAVVASRLGHHVLKVDDVMRDLDLKRTVRKNARASSDSLEAACAGKTYALVTMGCQMNVADSHVVETVLREYSLSRLGMAASRKWILMMMLPLLSVGLLGG